MADAVQELRQQLHKLGYDTRKEGGHFHIYKDGEKVRTRKGLPITLPSTPSDHRSLRNVVAQLRDQGILPRQAEVTPKHRATKLTRERLKQYSTQLRNDLIELMEQYNLRQVDIYTYADYYAKQHNIPGPATPQGVISNLIKQRKALSNTSYTWLSSAVSAIKAAEGKIPRAEEIRAGALASTPEPTPAIQSEEGQSEKVVFPTLAFDVLQMIYREDKDPVIVMSLIHQIFDLEMRGG